MPKIVLIEDDSTMLSLLKTLLEIEGYSAKGFDGQLDPDSMVETIHEEAPDLVLIDVHLRKLNGFDLLKAIRSDSRLKSLIVMMSSGMDVGEQCKRAGADGFILKPYMPDELLAHIRQAIMSASK